MHDATLALKCENGSAPDRVPASSSKPHPLYTISKVAQYVHGAEQMGGSREYDFLIGLGE